MGSYLSTVASAWDNYDGEELGQLISFEDSHVMSSKLQVS